MAEHTTTSIDIDNEIQDNWATLASNRTVSLKSTIVTTEKKYQPVLPSVNTTPLYNKQKTSSNKEDNPKTNKFTQDIEAYIK